MTTMMRLVLSVTLAWLLTGLSSGVSAEDEKLTPQEREELENEAQHLHQEGNRAYMFGKLDAALVWFNKSLSLRERLSKGQDQPELATSLNSMGVVLESLGQADKALPFYERALKMRERLYQDQNHTDLADSLNNMGDVLHTLGRADRALLYYERALVMNERLYTGQDHPELATSLTNMGGVLQALGQTDKAWRYYDRALKMRERLYKGRDHPKLASSLNNMGSMLQALGQTDKALPYYDRALKMREVLYKDQDHPSLALSLSNMGVTLSVMGRAVEALPHLERALQMRQSLYEKKDHLLVAQSLTNLGTALKAAGRTQEALDSFAQAVKMYDRLFKEQDHPLLAESLDNMGTVLQALGRSDEAVVYFERALMMRKRLYKDLAPPDRPRSPDKTGSVFQSPDLVVQTLVSEQRPPEMNEQLDPGPDHPELARTLFKMGLAHLSARKPGPALSCFEQVLEMNTRLVQREAATSPEQVALDFLRTLPDVRSLYLTLTRKEQTSTDKVAGVLWSSQSVVTKLLERRHFIHQETDQIRQLREQLAGVRALLTAALRRPLTDSQREDLLRDLTKEAVQLEGQLLQALPPRLRDAGKSRPDDLLAALPAGSVYLDILRYEEQDGPNKGKARYVAFVFTPRDKVVRVELEMAKAIDEAANGWRNAVLDWTGRDVNDRFRAGCESAAAKHATTLRQCVWDRIATTLPRDTTTVYHTVEGDLGRFPFAALPDGKGILLEKYAFASVLHGAALLDALRKPAAMDDGKGKMLVVGGLDYGTGQTWKLLPGMVREREQVGKLAAGRLLANLGGKDASVERLLQTLPEARYAHLATHGQFDEKQFQQDQEKAERFRKSLRDYAGGAGAPERLGLGTCNLLAYVSLALSGANEPDKAGFAGGILSGEVIVGLQLEKLNLVVLSACETGLGANTDTEGVRGLQRAFHLAGCPNVVASLWKVDDHATAALMNTFWEYVLVHQLPPVQALKEAQLLIYRRPDLVPALATRGVPDFDNAVNVNSQKAVPEKVPQGGRSYRHPYFWAGFFLSGAGR
jgi:CHAT domain-containing protein/Tfp pilus assembly protein PilF